jgi:hypothetical protein
LYEVSECSPLHSGSTSGVFGTRIIRNARGFFIAKNTTYITGQQVIYGATIDGSPKNLERRRNTSKSENDVARNVRSRFAEEAKRYR